MPTKPRVPDGTASIEEVARGLYQEAQNVERIGDGPLQVAHLVACMKASAILLGYKPKEAQP